MLSRRKLLFVSAIKQIAAQWFQLTSKGSSQAVIVISKPEMYYLGCVLQSSERLCPPLQKGFSFSFGFFFLLTFQIPSQSLAALHVFEASQITPVHSLCSTEDFGSLSVAY